MTAEEIFKANLDTIKNHIRFPWGPRKVVGLIELGIQEGRRQGLEEVQMDLEGFCDLSANENPDEACSCNYHRMIYTIEKLKS